MYSVYLNSKMYLFIQQIIHDFKTVWLLLTVGGSGPTYLSDGKFRKLVIYKG